MPEERPRAPQLDKNQGMKRKLLARLCAEIIDRRARLIPHWPILLPGLKSHPTVLKDEGEAAFFRIGLAPISGTTSRGGASLARASSIRKRKELVTGDCESRGVSQTAATEGGISAKRKRTKPRLDS
jgi:hypothetical protein